jgi:nucleotide-binding universal stress UspA family protein
MNILLPVDGSSPALQAVAHALRLSAEGLNTRFVLVNVQEPPSLYEVVVVHDAKAIEKLRADAGSDLVSDARAMLDAAGAEYEVEIASGDPASQLVEVLENHRCDAVVIGARGAGQPDAGDLGSVALYLLRHSPVAVTVVRAAAQVDVGDEGTTGSSDD